MKEAAEIIRLTIDDYLRQEAKMQLERAGVRNPSKRLIALTAKRIERALKKRAKEQEEEEIES